MSWWSRLANVFRSNRLSREIDEDLESHFAAAVEQGRDPVEARKALGPTLRLREESRDVRLATWLDSLRADAVFGWRQLMKNKVASAAAILSLAVGIGACISAFRLIDALLLRPLPVSEPGRLYVLSRQGIGPAGNFRTSDSNEYPLFQLECAAVRGQAELIAVSYADRADLTYGSDEETQKAHRQFVSGWMFDSFGLRPTLGRLLTAADASKPHAHPTEDSLTIIGPAALVATQRLSDVFFAWMMTFTRSLGSVRKASPEPNRALPSTFSCRP